MNIKFKLEPKMLEDDLAIIKQIQKEAKSPITDSSFSEILFGKEADLNDVLYGEEADINEFIA
jgi:hypothetical protein